MSETKYLPGSPRLFNNHSVCTECGAMVDNEFVGAHEVSHGREPSADFGADVRREADEMRNALAAPLIWEPIPKKPRGGFWPFRLRQ